LNTAFQEISYTAPKAVLKVFRKKGE